MNQMPHGWVTAKIGDTGRYINGFAFKPEHWGTEGRPIIRIQNLTDSSKELNRTEFVPGPEYVIQPNDLLVSWSATLDAYLWRGEEALLNQHIFRVLPDERIVDRRFLYYLLKMAIQQMQKTEHLHGSTMKHINRGPFMDFDVPIAPLPEQNRIVAEIEKQFTRLDDAVAALKRVQTNLKRYRASVLKAACEGRLVGSVPDEWKLLAVKDLLAEPLANGRSPQTAESGAKILKLTALNDGQVDIEQYRFGNLDEGQLTNLTIKEGDVLVSRGNGSIRLVGRAGLVRNTPREKIAYPDTMIRARVNKNLIYPAYLTAIWNSDFVRRQVEQRARTTAGIHKISQRDIEQITVQTPGLDTQTRILYELDRQVSGCNKNQMSVAGALKRADQLRRSVLEKAFSGKLVPQDPNDEPASVLLERIRAEREKGMVSKPTIGPRMKRDKAPVVSARIRAHDQAFSRRDS